MDTNVLYQALRGGRGASHYILQLIRRQEITLALSLQVFKEYEDVLTRPEKLKDLKLTRTDADKVLSFLAYIGKPTSTYFSFRPNLKDEKDNIFMELAVAGNAEYIITGNKRDFTASNELRFDDVKVVTPAEFVELWRKHYENQG